MQLIKSKDFDNFNNNNTCLAIGAFDGLHKGHQLIINNAINEAKQKNSPAAVLSFAPHPLEIIPEKTPPPSIMSRQQKIKLLENLKLDYYFEQKFNQKFAALSPRKFIKEILVEKLKVDTVVVGDNFHFAYQNKGNTDILKEMAARYGFNTKIISQLKADDDRISSTRIRSLLQNGKIEKVKQLLGRSYQLCGKVIHGKKRGRKLGFPTANLNLETNYALPPKGVYAAKVSFAGQEYLGAVNLGYSPTFNNKNITFEVFILDFEKDLYNKRLCVSLEHFIRSEKNFSSKADLIAQMEQDVLYTRELLC